MRAKIYHFLIVVLVFGTSPLQAAETLTWQQCVSEARSAHPDIYSALAVIQQAEADRRITAGALFPQLNVTLSSQERTGTAKASRSSSSFNYSLAAQQLLFDGNKTSKQIRSTEETINAAKYNYLSVSADLRFALRSAYTELLKAQDFVALAREIAERRRNNVRLINLRYQGGREHIGSLRQAEADQAQANFEVSQSERALLVAQVKLASALGRDQHNPIRVVGAFTVLLSSPGKPDMAILARNNPQFQQLDAQSKAARYDLDAARSVFLPQIYLTSTIGRSATDRLPMDAVDWNSGLTVSVPIYEGGSGRARVSRAMAVVSEHNAAQKSGYLQLYDTLEESWKSFQDARQLVTVRKKFLDAAMERSSIANAQYSNGLVTFNEWVIIENNLVSAKKEFLNAGADLLIAEAKWIQAKGGGVDGEEK